MARLLDKDDIGSFKIGEKIGEGGMAVIYKASQPSLKRDVVIKKLKDPNREIIARFKREAYVSASFSQENVLTVYDFIYFDRSYYLVMEYVDGDDLRDIIDYSSPLPVYLSALVIRDVARGLEYTHSKNIIHRDIKPSNILISKKGEVKLIDFGVARNEAPSKLTVTGMIVGTPSYMSPEQANGDKLNKQTDIYSLGVLLYEMLTGVKPFNGDTNTEILMKIAKGKYPSPKHYNRDLPMGIVRIIKKAMRKDTQHRYQTAAEMIRDLDKFIPWREQTNKNRTLSRYIENYQARPKTVSTSGFKYAGIYQGNSLWLQAGTVVLAALFLFGLFQMYRFLTNERYSSIELNSNVTQGMVQLNDRPAIALTSQKQIIKNVAPGKYEIVVHGNADRSVYQTNLAVFPNKYVIIRANLPEKTALASFRATSSPANAEIFINDRFIGKTPLPDMDIAGGEYDLKLLKSGFKPYQKRIKLNFNQSYHLSANLSPASGNPN